MTLPEEKHWRRVEELAGELGQIPSDQAASRMAELAAAGESRTVLTLLGRWLSLPPASAPVDIGQVIGKRYTLKEKLGEGGMGSVWRARQEMVGRDVALKMIHSALFSPALRARFVSEIELLGQLSHPGIVRIFDAGVHEQPNGQAIPFFAMELVEGLPLDRWSAQNRGARAAQLRVAAAFCAAVQSAHERRIVHRDLKPANILVKADGQPVVLDFGIARLAGMAAGDETGQFSGTPHYAAPEQHLGRDHDFRSGESVDVYAAGAILFEMISGRRLFPFPKSASISEMRRAILENPVPRLSELVPDCPSFLENIVARAVRRDPADRFYSMAALGRAISRAATLMGPVDTTLRPWSPAGGAIVPGTSWRLVEKIGEGGTGEVWTGIHAELGERRVFKFCDTEDKARTLKRELTLFRLLKERIGRNPHFIQLHEVSLDEPPWYLMMDPTDAQDLESWCAAQPGGLGGVSEGDRMEITAQAAEALQAAHEAGILHRDIKPANLLIKSNAAGGIHVFVADFGIGQIVADELLRGGTRLGFTRTVHDLQRNSLSGTILYLAPEVLEGNPATARSDIYSLGVVLWQLLIGNLHTALDPAGWTQRIEDPLLREDLTRCLAGTPEKRWESAGALASSLRALSDRRASEARRKADLAARERAAYRLGVWRTIAVAAGVVATVVGLAWIAWRQRNSAERARGEIALEQAASLRQGTVTPGQRERGLALLGLAARTATNRPAMRTAAAAVFGMPEIFRVSPATKAATSPSRDIPKVERESCRVMSVNGSVAAVARDVDGLNGAVDLIDVATGLLRCRVERKQFPWVPIAESGLLRFSPDDRMLAIGGSATSKHVLLCNVADGTLQSYLFQGSDPLSCAWHPGGRLMVTGCADGTVHVWDIQAAVTHSQQSSPGNQFDLRPLLDAPALDLPAHTIRGHRGPVQQLAFASGGRWLASIDRTGYLRVHTGFSRTGLPFLPPPGRAGDTGPRPAGASIRLALETRLDRADEITGLEGTDAGVAVLRGTAPAEEFRIEPGELPEETYVGESLADIAWDFRGAELCAITPTDIHFLRVSPMEVFYTIPGKNAVGVCGLNQEGLWGLPKDDQFRAIRPLRQKDHWAHEEVFKAPLAEAVKGQGAQTAITMAADGRVAVYRGRRIQFLANQRMAPLESSIIADGGGGVIRQVVWDRGGLLLGAVFRLASGRIRLESWRTSTNFPPICSALPPMDLPCDQVAPANDGRTFLARGKSQGILRADPATGLQASVDTTAFARQSAPFAVSLDGKMLAMVVDQTTIRILTLPSGTVFAELSSLRPANLTVLRWDPSRRRLASLSEDGYAQVWNLSPWQGWLAAHRLME